MHVACIYNFQVLVNCSRCYRSADSTKKQPEAQLQHMLSQELFSCLEDKFESASTSVIQFQQDDQKVFSYHFEACVV